MNCDKFTTEDVILRYSGRGMDKLRPYLEPDYCGRCAREILELQRGKVILITGFNVGGVCETDGPPGTFCLALALKKAGFEPVIAADDICEGYFEPFGLRTVYLNTGMERADFEKIIDEEEPVFVISIEHCGMTADGEYINSRNISIRHLTAQADYLLIAASERGILTAGIGDGGNEVGMGALADAITKELGLIPCATPADHTIIATTSNWGAYGLSRELGTAPKAEEIKAFTKHIVSLGSVDGITRKPECTVDGFAVEIDDEIMRDLGL